MSILNGLISNKDVIDFSSNFNVVENDNIFDQLFPKQKTQNFEAVWADAANNGRYVMANVHAYNTEAKEGFRPEFSVLSTEKFLIKEKLLLDEKLAEKMELYKDLTVLRNQVFNDMARTSNDVKVRTRVMDAELLSTGKITIDENGVKAEVDYGISAEQKPVSNWAATDADVVGDLEEWQAILRKNGYTGTRAVTSSKNINLLRKGLQTAIKGTTGGLLSKAEMNDWLESEFGFRFAPYDEEYFYFDNATKKVVSKRYIAEDKFILIGGNRNQAIGAGVYGVTPEERKAKLDVRASQNTYIMNTIWEENDPVGTWTKATAVYAPILQTTGNILIATV